jgi:hypothetical protein
MADQQDNEIWMATNEVLSLIINPNPFMMLSLAASSWDAEITSTPYSNFPAFFYDHRTYIYKVG